MNYLAEIPHGVRFHDGREMTSDDVAFTFRRFLDPGSLRPERRLQRAGAWISLTATP
jgi:ABC-type transport system substrate-binding protein